MLNKRVLRKIPCEEADERILSYAENTEKHVEWIVTANFADKDKKILLMTFYRVEDLRKNIKKAVSRTFLSNGYPNSKELGQKKNMEPKNDYITQDMRVSNARWLTASFEMMTDPIRMWNWWEPISNRAYILPEHTQLVKDFFKEYAEESDKSVWRAVMRFQSGVRAERLNLKHEKETDRIDRVMSRVGEVPIEFKAWCKDKVLEFSRYLIYKDIGGGMVRCRCTQCGNTGEVKRREITLKHKAEGICPFCGSKVSIAAEGRLKSFHDSCRAAFVEPFDAGFMVRIFDCHREGGSAVPTRDYMIEDLRAVYTPKNGRQEKEFEVVYYEWAEFKNTGKVRWCYDGNKIRYDGRYMLYPNNLPQAWQHTYLKYSAIEILSKNVSEPLNYGNAIKCIADFPKLEWLIKMGFTRLVKDRLHWDGRSRCDLNEDGKTIYDILGLQKADVKTLQYMDGNAEALATLRRTRAEKIKWTTAAEFMEFAETFGNNEALISELKRTTYHKLMKFINRECQNYYGERCVRYIPLRTLYAKEIQRKRNLAADWIDYLRWRREMGRDTEDEFVYFPKNFKAVHDREQEDYMAMLDRRMAAEREREEKRLRINNKYFRTALDNVMGACGFNDKHYMIVVPDDAEAIRKEGETLHHCVATYINLVAKGLTNILFVRTKDAPSAPFYTLEYKDGKVMQCRGSRNKAMTPEIRKFVDKFEAEVLKKAEENMRAEREKGVDKIAGGQDKIIKKAE